MSPHSPEPARASDVVAFGHEVGRVLSDGTVIGRAEPFAKVFPSSRAVKRAVGPTAWAILEDIALDAQLDVEGRLVAETNIRRIADNLDLGKNTVYRHLAKLRDHGFVLHEEQRQVGSGRYETARYVLDPSACLERFTTTPPADDGLDREAVENPSKSDQPEIDPTAVKSSNPGCDAEFGGSSPCTHSGDTAGQPVSPNSGSRDWGHNNKKVVETQQPHPQPQDPPGCDAGSTPAEPDDPDGGLAGRLIDLGIDDRRAKRLVDEHPTGQIRDALAAVGDRQVRSEAGWVVAAITRGWDLPDADVGGGMRRAAHRRSHQDPEVIREQAKRAAERNRWAAGWARALSAALDDRQLARVVDRVADGLPGAVAGSMPAVQAGLVEVAADAAAARPDWPLAEAVLEQLAGHDAGAVRGDAGRDRPVQPPAVDGEPPDLAGRIRGVLDGRNRDLDEPGIGLDGP